MVSPITITFTFNGDTAAAQYVNAAQLDTQLANLASTVNAEILERQRTVRDGSGLAAQVVTYASLHPQVTGLLAAGGVIPKQAAAVVGLSNIVLTGLQVIDGYTLLANDRVLLTAQTNAAENGLWVAAAGAWTRPTDAAVGAVLSIYTQVGILYGQTFPGALFILSAAATVGTTAQTWFLFSAPSTAQIIESTVSTATNAAATGTYLALASITLPAGSWTISAIANGEPGTAAVTTVGGALEALIGSTTASSAGATRGYDWAKSSHELASGDCEVLTIPSKRVSIVVSTTYYLNVLATYTAGTPQWRGSLSAARIR